MDAESRFGGGIRYDAVGLSIGSKGYVGMGFGSDVSDKKDFWEYDPSSNTWTQKADIGGIARSLAVGFSIGNKGYVGTGASQSIGVLSDFWEYDPALNIWTQKADFGGGGRVGAIGFSLGGKGYLGTGGGGGRDFWEYDPSGNAWTQKADFGGIDRQGAVGFGLGNKGYIGTGSSGLVGFVKDFWEYNPVADTWTQKADFGGVGRTSAVGFGIAGKGYIGTGYVGCCVVKDFWEYDPSLNIWTQKADFGGVERYEATGFSLAGKGYIGTGGYQDFWQYTPDEGTSTCDTPTSLSTSNVTGTTADLQWDTVSGAVEYEVAYKVVGASQFTIVHAAGNSTTLADLTPLTQYVWRVRTVCSLSPPLKSAYSALVQFTTTNGCDIPTSLSSETTATTALLTWGAVNGAIRYEIMYRMAGSTTWATTQATRSRLRLTRLTPRTRYFWKVKTVCSDSPPISSDYSVEESFFTFPF